MRNKTPKVDDIRIGDEVRYVVCNHRIRKWYGYARFNETGYGQVVALRKDTVVLNKTYGLSRSTHEIEVPRYAVKVYTRNGKPVNRG